MEGTPFGRYRLLELLGRGGMGEVWRAFDTDTDRIVAVKVLPQQFVDDADFQQRFRREARAAAGLNEPHVVPIHAYGEIDGRLYVDMRLIKGRDLQSVLADGPLHPQRAVMIVEQVASALDAAHQEGLVHRDVKPSNILIAADDFAYLIDFGIARAAGETGLTSTGATIGTWAYMAPERIESGKIDPRSDVYSLACVLHECLTGQRPFPGDSFEQLAAAHMWKPPPRPSESRFGLPRGLDHVVAKGMAKNPDERFATTRALAHDARHAITATAPNLSAHPPPQQAPFHPVPPTVPQQNPSVPPGVSGLGPTEVAPPHYQMAPAATPPPFHGSRRPPTRRRRVIILGGLTVAVVAIVATVIFVFLGSKSSDEEQIRSVVAGMEDAWNSSDYEAYSSYFCAKDKNDKDFDTEKEFQSDRSYTGRTELTVQAVHVDGDKATVYLRFEDENKEGRNPTDVAGTGEMAFVREDGKWKRCDE